MGRPVLTLEPVQLDTLAEGTLWDAFHTAQEQILTTIRALYDKDSPQSDFYHPSKERQIVMTVKYTPKDGGVGVDWSLETKIPTKKHSRGGFGQFEAGKLMQYAARQQDLPDVGPAPKYPKVTPIRKAPEGTN